MNNDTPVFRNPYRGRKVAKTEAYQPEYDRLKVEPVRYPIDQTEAAAFTEKNQVVPKKMVQQRPPTVPKQAKIHSGDNEDNLWTKALEDPQQKIMADEVPLPPPVVKETGRNVGPGEDNIVDDVGLDDNFGLESLKPGEYILLYNDSVICVGALDFVKETLADILTDSQNDVDIDDFVVLKRLKVNVGIFIDE